MAWVKLDDQFFINRKARAAGLEGRALAAASWCYCAMQRNDGIFLADDIPVIAAMAGVPQDIGDRLLDIGMWHALDGGLIQVHDYLEHNLSNEQMIARSEKASRAASARHAPGNASSSAPSTAGGGPPSQPIPSPSPIEPSPLPSTSDLDRLPPDLWTTMASKKVGAAKNVTNAKGYQRKCVENDRKDPELVARAIQLTEMFDLTTGYLAECLIAGSTPSPAYRKQPAA